MSESSYEATPWSQKEVLTLVQKIVHDKKTIFLPSANWSNLDLRGINLKNANLKFANLSRTNLQLVDLENANLRHANLSNADLSNAKLVSTDLAHADCTGTKFDGATGLGTRFREKWSLPPEQEETPKKKSSKSKELEKTKSSETASSRVSSDLTPELKSSTTSTNSDPPADEEQAPNAVLLTEEQVRAEWDRADKDKSGTLSFKEIMRLLRKLNLKLKEKDAKKRFKEVDVDNSNELDFGEFTVFLERLRVRPEIQEIFDALPQVQEKGYLTAEEFLNWIVKVQGDKHWTVDSVAKIIAQCEKKVNDEEPTKLYVTGFQSYLGSAKWNGIFSPNKETVYQDMNKPFAHYWVASSHNTYLMGDQLKGESSIEAYINAFRKGCKCVELDCWDNAKDITMPIIYHGGTLTSKIFFKEVLETVRDYGFSVSDYPVILSLEVHCSIEGQQHMARLVKEVLGAADMIPPQPDVTGVLPPPGELKRKVLLKGKMLSKSLEESQAEEYEEEEEEEEEEQPKDKKLTSSSKEADKKKEKVKAPKTAKELSELIHLKAVHFKGFEDSKAKGKAWEMSSFSENKVNKLMSKSAVPLVDYCSRQLARIYPKGLRVDSSNYDPVPAWNCGAQIVALNYQTGSLPMWLNDGKFLDNGRAGYLLKPDEMIVNNPTFNPEGKKPAQKTLIVKVISGWQFPKFAGKETKDKGGVLDPYVKVKVFGLSADDASQKTKVIKNNGFNPLWDQEFKFPIAHIETALLLFSVNSSDVIGHYSLRATCVREGYRTIPLKDKHGNTYEKASLLVHLKWA